MMASWNVVSIYSACGSDFPDLHRSIVTLKSVLQDFDEAFGKRVDRETPKYRHDFCGHTEGDENGGGDGNRTPDEHRHDGRTRPISHALVNNENAGGIVGQPENLNADQHKSKQKDVATPNDDTEQTSDEEKLNISSPFQPPRPANVSEGKEGEITQNETQNPRTNPHSFSSPTSYNTTKFPSRKCLSTRSATPYSRTQPNIVPKDARAHVHNRATTLDRHPTPLMPSPRTSTLGAAPVANMVPNGQKNSSESNERDEE